MTSSVDDGYIAPLARDDVLSLSSSLPNSWVTKTRVQGEVYKAKDTRLDRTVAIKVLPSHLANNPDLKQRFEREARTIAAPDYPQSVQCLGRILGLT